VNSKDRNLGMDRPISRRDILHGVGVMAAASLVPGQSLANQILAPATVSTGSAGYPPVLTGMRGNHDGSFDVVHQLALEARRDWGPAEEPDFRVYDLVIVGAGISGLAAAYFYRQANPDVRILILDNHDDFGGHARRNEFNIAGHRLIGYGGSQTLEAPSGYSDVVKSLLRDLKVDVSRFDSAYDQGFYKRHGLSGGVVFNREEWGVDRLVPYDLGALGGYLPLAPSELSAAEAVQQMPMSDSARNEMLRLLTVDEDQMPEIPADAKYDYFYTISYRDFLSKHVGISEREVFAALKVQVRAPMLYTSVALRNWQAWKNLGIGAVVSTGGYHVNAMLDFPVTMGGYEFASGPDDPIVVHMERFPHRPNEGLGERAQRRFGRHELLATSFETIERNVRSQLAATLADGGFDPARDIEAITVNRWAHGYSYTYNDLEGPYYKDWDDERYPHVRARKPFGRITIANSDAGADAMMEVAVEQAHRAVSELA